MAFMKLNKTLLLTLSAGLVALSLNLGSDDNAGNPVFAQESESDGLILTPTPAPGYAGNPGIAPSIPESCIHLAPDLSTFANENAGASSNKRLYEVSLKMGVVSVEDESVVRCGAGLIHDYAENLNMSPIGEDIDVYLLNMHGSLLNMWEDAFGEGVAAANVGDIVIVNPSSKGSDEDNLLRSTIREMSRAQRYTLSRVLVSEEVRKTSEPLPKWVDDAISAFHGVRVMTNAGLGSRDYTEYRSFL